jgi:hypothetical protein
LFCCFLSAIASSSGASEIKGDSLFIIKGQIISSKTGRPIPFTHILNLTRRTGTFCDSLGFFNMWVESDNVLKATSVGYYDKTYFVRDWSDEKRTFVKITLVYRTYALPIVDIKEKLNKEIITYQIEHCKFKKDQIDIIKDKLVTKENTVEELKILYQSTKKGFTLNFKSSQDIQIEKLNILIEKERLIKRVENLAKSYTRLDGEQLQKFIKYCYFRDEFIVHASDYELLSMIKYRYNQSLNDY